MGTLTWNDGEQAKIPSNSGEDHQAKKVFGGSGHQIQLVQRRDARDEDVGHATRGSRHGLRNVVLMRAEIRRSTLQDGEADYSLSIKSVDTADKRGLCGKGFNQPYA